MNTAARIPAGLHKRTCQSIYHVVANRRRSPTVAATSPSAVHSDATAAYQALCALISAHGGFVHPALRLDPELGGISATHDIQQPKGSLVELPLSLRLTTAAAQELLLPALNAAGLPTMSLLEEDQQLALALAWLRNQDTEATCKWIPYVRSMPQQTSCGWAKSTQQLAADFDRYLGQHGLDISWWRYFVAQVQQQMQESAEKLAAKFGKALGVTSADVLWALGQVQTRKVVIDNEVFLEPWSDLLRHPPSQDATTTTTSSRCEVQWTYGLCRNATAVVSRGAGQRVAVRQPMSTGSSSSSSSSPLQSAPSAMAQEDPEILLAGGEELWASSTSSGGSAGDLWRSCIEQQGHLAPLAWYLQHGVVPEGLAAVKMRTSDILESWRCTIASEKAGSSTAPTAASSSGNDVTVLWDYLTQQYQQDVLTVLAATPVQQQQQLLQFLMQPVAADTSPSEVIGAAGAGNVVADVDPLPLIGALDELLIAAIDAAEAAGSE